MSETPFPTGPTGPTGSTDPIDPSAPTGGSIPPPPAPGGLPAAWASDSTSPQRRSRRPIVAIALVVVIALVGGAATYATLRSEPGASGSGTPLLLAFDRGDQTTYDINVSMDGSIDLGALGEQPLNVDLRESVGWKVLDVDDDGVATVRVSVDGVSGSANGISIPSGQGESSTTLRVTPDGQILEANGLSLGATGGTGIGGFPGMDQVTPILPDHEVSPGDEWDKDFSQSLPFGDGTIEYTAHSTFERYEQTAGVRAAVITTTYTVPFDFSIDLRELAKAMGGDTGQGIPGLGGADATIVYDGSGTFTQTSWLDIAARQMLKTNSHGNFDMTISFPGMQEQLGTDHFGMSATFSMRMTAR